LGRAYLIGGFNYRKTNSASKTPILASQIALSAFLLRLAIASRRIPRHSYRLTRLHEQGSPARFTGIATQCFSASMLRCGPDAI
jgi:hypothetical protein